MRQPPLQVVGTLQNGIDGRSRESQLEVPGAIENRLHFMGEFLDVPKLQEAGQPFDGVEAAENGMQRLGVAGIALQGEDLRFYGGQILAALQDEIRQ